MISLNALPKQRFSISLTFNRNIAKIQLERISIMKFKGSFAIKIICLIFIFNGDFFVNSKTIRKRRGVIDNFNDGLKYAGQMFGINTAADVANLVAKAFSAAATRQGPDLMSAFQQHAEHVDDKQQQQQQNDQYSQEQHEEQDTEQSVNNGDRITPTTETLPQEMNTARLITSVLKMIGFDAGKLGALAINALIMIAQAIGSTLMSNTNRKRVIDVLDGSQKHSTTGPEDAQQQPRMLRSGSPIDWFLENPNKEMRTLIGDITDVKLADRLTAMIENLETKSEHEGACIKMLMCKSSPFIWGMQKSLAKRLNNNTLAGDNENSEHYFMSTKGFFTHLPSITEYREHGKECEKRFSTHCNITSAYPK